MAGEAGAVPVTSASPSLSTSVGDLDTSSAKEALQQQEAKAARIVDACNARNVDLLASLASEDGGYLRDDLRQRACTSPNPLPEFTAQDAGDAPFGLRRKEPDGILVAHAPALTLYLTMDLPYISRLDADDTA
jgi:hypothetical protein